MKSDSKSTHIGLRDLSKKSEDIAEYYDNWAKDYDINLSDWRYEAPEKIASMLRAELSAKLSPELLPNLAILDAGCGTGLGGKALLASGFTTIDGVDVSRRSLEIARKTEAYRTLRNVDLQKPPLPIEDNVYDALCCVGVLTYITDSSSALREFSRVVKPKGFVALTQRSDLFEEREFPNVLRKLSNEGVIAQVRISEPKAYLPDNEEFSEQILVHYIGFTVV